MRKLYFLLAVLTCSVLAVAFIEGHELAHKEIAEEYGCSAEASYSFSGAPGFTEISDCPEGVYGEMMKQQMNVHAVSKQAGPVLLALLVVIFLEFYSLSEREKIRDEVFEARKELEMRKEG